MSARIVGMLYLKAGLRRGCPALDPDNERKISRNVHRQRHPDSCDIARRGLPKIVRGRFECATRSGNGQRRDDHPKTPEEQFEKPRETRLIHTIPIRETKITWI